MMEEALKIIKEEIKKNGLKVLKILLFGSRAKGNYKQDSDFDFFVIVDKKLSFNEKWDIIDGIKIKLAKLRILNDIIIKSNDEIEEEKYDVGRITYYVFKEGIEVWKKIVIKISKPFGKTHDIAEFIELCKENNDEFEYLYEIKANKLTRYAVEVRYPDEFYIPSIEEAKEAVEIAKKVKSFMLEKFKLWKLKNT